MSSFSTFDISLKHPSTWIINGVSNSGKTEFVKKLLEKKNELFKPYAPKFGVLFYKQWQPAYSYMLSKGLINEFIVGIPEEDEMKNIFLKYKKHGGCFAIFDDLMNEVNSSLLSSYTIWSHHLKVTVITLVQSLFLENKLYRICSLNSNYIVIMKSVRDNLSISHLSRQISPYNTKYITEAYMQATKTPYSYLLFDLRQETSDVVRLRSNIFSTPVSIYIENDNKKKKK